VTKIVHKKQFAKRFFGVEETQEEVVLMPITFEGLPPFDLGLSQRATAQSSNGSVEMTLWVVRDAYGPIPQPHTVRMGYQQARAFAIQVSQAAADAELKKS
jgi:hypothetical protein